METKTWCVEWFGSEGDFLAGGKRYQHGREPSEKAKSHFSIEKEAIEIVGFYSMNHRGIVTPRDSSFHMHLRTLDNRISGHLESVQWNLGFTVELPAKER